MGSSKKYTRFFLCLTLFAFMANPGTGLAAKQSQTGGAAQENNKEFSARVQELVDFLEETTEDFTYQRQNRPDPFLPFIPQKPVVVEKKSIDVKELEGLQKYEPGQLSVVAIIQSSGRGEAKAMVQDAAGKGFIIRPGTEIGRYGIVDSISANVVTVKERYQMTSGETQTEIVKMLLKKEGEE